MVKVIKEEEEPTSPEKQLLTDERKEDDKNEFNNKTFFEKVNYVKSNITVEPILAGLVIPSMLSRLAIQNLNLEKACRIKLGLDEEICNAFINKDINNTLLQNKTYIEADVQKVISAIEAWKSIIQTSLPSILIIIMGAWSDRTGNRKFCILLPLIGELLVCVCNIISTIFFEEIPVEVTMFFEGLLPAITGGWVLMFLGVFSYIGDITNSRTRTFRMGLVNLCLTAGIPIGSAASGFFLKWFGYYGIFGVSAAIHVINILYGSIYLKGNTKEIKESEKKKSITCIELVTLVKETVMFPFKKREGGMRKMILVTLFIVAILYGPSHGERVVFYWYLRYKLEWNAVKFSMYSTYSVILHSLGALFSISVFSKRWGFHDSVLCLISIISKLVGSVFLAFVQTDFHMVLLPIVEILNATTWTSLRSMTSKQVSSKEMGKMNSVFSLVETLAAMLFDPIYSGIYRLTIELFAGTIFMFSAALVLPAAAFLLWIFLKHRQEVSKKKKEAVAQEKNEGDVEIQIITPPENVDTETEHF